MTAWAVAEHDSLGSYGQLQSMTVGQLWAVAGHDRSGSYGQLQGMTAWAALGSCRA